MTRECVITPNPVIFATEKLLSEIETFDSFDLPQKKKMQINYPHPYVLDIS